MDKSNYIKERLKSQCGKIVGGAIIDGRNIKKRDEEMIKEQ